MPNQLKQFAKPIDIVQQTQNQIAYLQKEGSLAIPDNYSVANALASAQLILQDTKDRNGKSVFETCTPSSIYQSLLNMVLQGLNPAMSQCYFIVYGNQLQMRRSYFGTVTALLRLPDIKKVQAQVVHKGDEFEIGSNEDFETVVTKFTPKIENQDSDIVDAFAIIKLEDGSKAYTIMTKHEIDQSWSQSRSRQNNVQKKFAQEMAKRTVLNRAAKMFINTADDSQMIAGAINRTTQNEYDHEPKDVTPATGKAQQLSQQFQASKAELNTGKEEPDNANQDHEEATGQTDIYDYLDQNEADPTNEG